MHLYGVAQACTPIALKRGQNAELATMAGMLHDIYSYTNETLNHAHKGAILAKDILSRLQITNDEETNIICNAIYNHSDKGIIQSDFEEILIDADVLQHCLYNPVHEIAEHEKERFEKLKKEFNLFNN